MKTAINRFAAYASFLNDLIYRAAGAIERDEVYGRISIFAGMSMISRPAGAGWYDGLLAVSMPLSPAQTCFA